MPYNIALRLAGRELGRQVSRRIPWTRSQAASRIQAAWRGWRWRRTYREARTAFLLRQPEMRDAMRRRRRYIRDMYFPRSR